MGFATLLSSIGASVATVFVLYCAALFGYRILLHPLRSYPGPFLAKLSDSYAGFYALTWRLHLVTRRDHLKYGPVMRYGPNRLVFNSAAAFRGWPMPMHSERVTKSEVYRVTQQLENVYNVFNVRDRAEHRLKRKLIGRAVTEQSMRSFEPTMTAQIEIFLRQVLQAAQARTTSERMVNMTQPFKYLGYDIVGHLAFGYPLKLQTDDSNRFVVKANAYGNFRLNMYMQWPLLRHLRIESVLDLLPNGLRVRLFNLIETMIKARLAQDKDARRDLFFYAADDFREGNDGLRLGNLWTEAIFFLPAGGDTTSTALASLFFYLSRNPVCYAKLCDEIRTTFRSGADIRGGPQLAGCSYLRACIDEALRMSPPVPGTLWRQLAYDDPHTEPWVVDGHVIPSGTEVGVNIYALHHNEEYFPDPFSFKPERWLAANDDRGGESGKAGIHNAFAAFSAGPRGCAGKAMAYLEASLVTARTLWYFDFEAAPGRADGKGARTRGRTDGHGSEGEFRLYDVFISIHNGPHLAFRTRGDYYRELTGGEL
ncbi:hypothetical protein DL764_000032 [Monosporascus ibericus]|uniref:Cytochrome P450 n=1 Tax=Monosporascus ibericus TaxID=155417 RepID=A0A4V1XCZ9_9PEZI|nr:hypothetical protein DL764_000032 [Monosporascus ibericus]